MRFKIFCVDFATGDILWCRALDSSIRFKAIYYNVDMKIYDKIIKEMRGINYEI